MKTLRVVLVVGALCLLALFVIRAIEDVSVDVMSCTRDGTDAVVTVRYINHLRNPVRVSYDLVLSRDVNYSVSGRSGVRPLNMKRISSVTIAANDEKQDVIRIECPKGVFAPNAFVMNIDYER